MKLIITETAQCELKRFGFDIRKSIKRILRYIPLEDLRGISHILVNDVMTVRPEKHKKLMAAYFKEQNKKKAHIELYLKGLFGHISDPANLRKLLPIQEYGLASTLFHEVGHHVREIRTHSIRNRLNEKFAERYAWELLSKYIMDNAENITECFKNLEETASLFNIKKDVLENMRKGWEAVYRKAMSTNSHQ